eukprot:3137605-Rhodomonas_salina.1
MFGQKDANHYTSQNVTMRAGVCFAFYQETIRHVFSSEEVLAEKDASKEVKDAVALAAFLKLREMG